MVRRLSIAYLLWLAMLLLPLFVIGKEDPDGKKIRERKNMARRSVTVAILVVVF